MNAQEIQNKIDAYIAANSGLEQHRNYLGISKIAGCPRAAVLEYRNGVELTEQAHRMCYAGYEQEKEIYSLAFKARVANLGTRDVEVVSNFDNRLRGHIDSDTVDGELLEIKSVSLAKFEKVENTGRALFGHFIQVQLYMRYGPWKTCFIIYRCRETYEHIVIRVPYQEGQAAKFEKKAKDILRHIDAGTLPECECGRCKS
jgi:hypothetical protein